MKFLILAVSVLVAQTSQASLVSCKSTAEFAALSKAKGCSVVSSKGKAAGMSGAISWAIDLSCGGKTVEASVLTVPAGMNACRATKVDVQARAVECDLTPEKEDALNELRISEVPYRVAKSSVEKVLRTNRCISAAIRATDSLSVSELAEEILDVQNNKSTPEQVINKYLNQ